MTRLASDALLDKPVSALRFVTAARAQKLKRRDIVTVRDLLQHYPHRYIDLTTLNKAATVSIGQTATVCGTIQNISLKRPRPGLDIVEAALLDDTGLILGVWFRQPWIADKLKKGMRVVFSGKVIFDYGFKRINSPFFEVLEKDAHFEGRMIPIHYTTKGISTAWMRRFITEAFEEGSDFHDFLPAKLRARLHLTSRKAALRGIHFPSSHDQYRLSARRLSYEEAFLLQLVMQKRHFDEVRGCNPYMHVNGESVKRLKDALPFTLTMQQTQAAKELMDDMCSKKIMNRMLLGDVGCGKTIITAFGFALCKDSSSQAAMMAPTEVLARQYEKSLGPLLTSCGLRWASLTGSTKKSERMQILEALRSGEIDVIFGTHALLGPNVIFNKLSFVVIDEQHRFGVEQRTALRKKGDGVDLLVMTATPIPRTLALTLYGDLETSVIKERPIDRPETKTVLLSRSNRAQAYAAIKEALDQGRQAYIICPLVGLSRIERKRATEEGSMAKSLAGYCDISNLKAATNEADYLSKKVFPDHNVGLLTGRMSSAEKHEVMERFRTNDIQVLVSTTVVEVGVDVYNASVMMIEDAERFGLSQLHQLRGRVGRGKHSAQVFIVADPGRDDTELTQRLQSFVNSNDGFKLAEADLRNRKEGEVLGSKQSGMPALRLINVLDDYKIIRCAHDDVQDMLAQDPHLKKREHNALKKELKRIVAKLDANAVQEEVELA